MEPHASQLCHAAHELSLQPEAEKIRVKWTEVCRFVAAATSSRMTHHILSVDGNSDAVYKGSLLVNKVGKKRRTIPARFIHHTSQPFEHRLEHLRSGMQLKIFSYLCTVLHY